MRLNSERLFEDTQCLTCRGTGTIIVPPFYEQRCPDCNGMRSNFQSHYVMKFDLKQFGFYCTISALACAIGGAMCALCIVKPVGGLVAAFSLYGLAAGVITGALTLHALTLSSIVAKGDVDKAFQTHLHVMFVLAVVAGVLGALVIVPLLASFHGAELRSVFLRIPVTFIFTARSMTYPLRFIKRMP